MLSDQREPTHIPAILDVKVWKVATMCQRDQGQIRWWCFFSVSRIYPILFYTVGVVVSFGQSSIRHPAPLPPRAVAELQKHIKTLDTQYDACNDAWATGEADKFTGEKLLDIIILLASLAVKKYSRWIDEVSYIYIWWSRMLIFNVKTLSYCLDTAMPTKVLQWCRKCYAKGNFRVGAPEQYIHCHPMKKYQRSWWIENIATRDETSS